MNGKKIYRTQKVPLYFIGEYSGSACPQFTCVYGKRPQESCIFCNKNKSRKGSRWSAERSGGKDARPRSGSGSEDRTRAAYSTDDRREVRPGRV